MGWFAYGIYDGDDTFTFQLCFLEDAGITDDRQDELAEMSKIKLTDAEKKLVKKALPKIIKKIESSNKFGDDCWMVDWQMLGDLCMNNKIKMLKKDVTSVAIAWKFLMGEHADDFDEPGKRKVQLRQWKKRWDKFVESWTIPIIQSLQRG